MVKEVPDRTGRFERRPHYEPLELDRECERIVTEFLRSRYGKVEFPISTDDLTVLIERDVADFDPYADLSAFGPGVEGVTQFRPGKKPLVKISVNLTEDEARENRLRTTLTHEYGHVRFHAYLWEIQPPNREQLKRSPHLDKIVCKRDTMINAADADWMEWQAGYICGALLMPMSRVKAQLAANGGIVPLGANADEGRARVELIAHAFQVSKDAARIRLLKLGILKNQ